MKSEPPAVAGGFLLFTTVSLDKEQPPATADGSDIFISLLKLLNSAEIYRSAE